MRSVRVIPCLDVDDGRVVKGVRFVDLVDAGDPVELAARYDAEGADELVFLDITASADDRRDTMVDVVARTAEQVFIPFTVGGGVRSARRRPPSAAGRGRQGRGEHGGRRSTRLVARAGRGVRGPVRGGGRRRPPHRATGWEVFTHGGRQPTGIDAVAWARRCAEARGGRDPAHLHGPRRDRSGFDLALTRAVVDAVDVPVVASGGVGDLEHLVEGAVVGGADAVLAASIFHFGSTPSPRRSLSPGARRRRPASGPGVIGAPGAV